MLHDIEETIRSVADSAGPSIVSIGRNGRGTGFVIAADRVLTSAHNLRDQTVAVTFADGRAEQGSAHGVDTDGDVVVLAVPTGDVPPLQFATELPSVGTAIVSLSRGGHRARATLGFVSSVDQSFRGPRGRIVRGSIEHTAVLARGSSGGPVFNRAGEVVGVNTHRAGEGFYLARAADDVLRTRIAELLEGRSPVRRTLGIAVAPPKVAAQLRQAVGLPERDGLLVRGVDANGPAGRGGVQSGDLLVNIGERNLVTVDDLQEALEQLDADTVTLGIVRGAEELTVTISFVEPTDAGTGETEHAAS